jgi:arylsulfatase A-like enzyme
MPITARLRLSMKIEAAMISLFLLACFFSAEAAQTPMAPHADTEQGHPAPPNVIWIVLDACRQSNLSCYGYERQTSPAIDGLAKSGTLFESHFSQGLMTSISVPSYMTGRYYPVLSADAGYVIDPRFPPAGEMLFPEILKNHGYHTLCITSQIHVGPQTGLGRSFDECHFVPWPKPQEKPYLDNFMPLVLERLAAQPAPYFMYLHLMGPHFPHLLPPPFDRWTEEEDVGRIINGGGMLPDGSVRPAEGNPFTADEKKHLVNLYDGSISRTDKAIGDLLEKLGESGAAKNTIVVISSDHGEQLGKDGYTIGHGNTCDEIMRVPLIISGPGIPEARRISEFTENVDIVPTLCDLLGIKPKAVFDGRSLVPLMAGAEHPVKQYVIAVSGSYESRPGAIIRTGTHKFIYDNASGNMSLLSCPDKAVARKYLEITPELRADFMRIVDSEITPRWKASLSFRKKYVDLNLNEPAVLEQVTAYNSQAKEDANGKDPGHWTQTADGITCDTAWRADLKPLSLTLQVPSHRYRVYVKLHASQNAGADRTIAVSIKAGTVGSYQTVLDDPRNEVTENTGFHEMGVVDVRDGLFPLCLTACEGDAAVSVCKFRLVEDEGFSRVDKDEAIEQLKSMGYL